MHVDPETSVERSAIRAEFGSGNSRAPNTDEGGERRTGDSRSLRHRRVAAQSLTGRRVDAVFGSLSTSLESVGSETMNNRDGIDVRWDRTTASGEPKHCGENSTANVGSPRPTRLLPPFEFRGRSVPLSGFLTVRHNARSLEFADHAFVEGARHAARATRIARSRRARKLLTGGDDLTRGEEPFRRGIGGVEPRRQAPPAIRDAPSRAVLTPLRFKAGAPRRRGGGPRAVIDGLLLG